MVLQYAGVETDPSTLYRELYVPALGGTTSALLVAAAQRRGARAETVYGTMSDLASWLCAGVPPIVLLRLSGDAETGHFVVVTGLNREGSVRVHSGQKEGVWYSQEQFDSLWANGRYTAVLIGIAIPGLDM